MLDVKILIGDSEIPVGHSIMERLIDAIPDEPGYEQAYRRLALFGSTKVQEAIASRESIDAETVEILLRSKQVNVLRPLLCNPRAQEALTQREAMQIANSNQPELLGTLAWNLGDFSLCSPLEILQRLAANTDPWVRALVIDRPSAPLEMLETLSKDDDPDVQRGARKAIEERENESDSMLGDE